MNDKDKLAKAAKLQKKSLALAARADRLEQEAKELLRKAEILECKVQD